MAYLLFVVEISGDCEITVLQLEKLTLSHFYWKVLLQFTGLILLLF